MAERLGVLRLDIEVGEPRPFGRKLVDAGGRRAAQYSAAVHAQFAVAEVVHEDEQDVGLLVLGDRGRIDHETRGKKGRSQRSAQTSRKSHLSPFVPVAEGEHHVAGRFCGPIGPAGVLIQERLGHGSVLLRFKVRQRPGPVEVGLGRLVEPEIRKPVFSRDRRNPVLLETGRRFWSAVDVNRIVSVLA